MAKRSYRTKQRKSKQRKSKQRKSKKRIYRKKTKKYKRNKSSLRGGATSIAKPLGAAAVAGSIAAKAAGAIGTGPVMAAAATGGIIGYRLSQQCQCNGDCPSPIPHKNLKCPSKNWKFDWEGGICGNCLGKNQPRKATRKARKRAAPRHEFYTEEELEEADRLDTRALRRGEEGSNLLPE